MRFNTESGGVHDPRHPMLDKVIEMCGSLQKGRANA